MAESDGHGSFYGTIGISLSAAAYPLYSWIQPYFVSGIGDGVDSLVLISGVAGVIIGLLYYVPIDRLIDRYLVKKARFSIHRQFKIIPRFSENEELLRSIAYVDYLSCSWRSAYWLGIEDAADNAINSATKDVSVQKDIWYLKNLSVIGFAFVIGSITLSNIGITEFALPIIALIVGGVFLVYPWFSKRAKAVPLIIYQIAICRYAKDTIVRWRPIGSVADKTKLVMKQLAEDTKDVEDIIVGRQWKRLKFYYSWLNEYLMNENDYGGNLPSYLLEIWARALCAIHISTGKEEPQKQKWVKYRSAWDLFRMNGLINRIEWAAQFDTMNFIDMKKFIVRVGKLEKFISQYNKFFNDLDIAFRNIDPLLKVEWVNHLVKSSWNISLPFRTSFNKFIGEYDGDLLDDAVYRTLVLDEYKVIESIGTNCIDSLVKLVGDSGVRRHILNVLVEIWRSPDVYPTTRKHIKEIALKNDIIQKKFDEYDKSWRDY